MDSVLKWIGVRLATGEKTFTADEVRSLVAVLEEVERKRHAAEERIAELEQEREQLLARLRKVL